MMSALIEGIQKNKFAVLGRAGMDMFADPIGVKSEKASTIRYGCRAFSEDLFELF